MLGLVLAPVIVEVMGASDTVAPFAVTYLRISIVGAPALLAVDFAAVPRHVWLLGGLVIVGPTALAYLLNLYALRRLPTSLVGLFINVQFVIAAVTAALWHGERLDDRTVLAAAAVLLGLSLRFVPERPVPT